jgi:hypothetical protein
LAWVEGGVVVEPRVGPKVGGGGTVFSNDLHALHYYVSRAKGNVVRYVKIAVADFRIELFVVLASVRKLSAEESK